MKVEFFKHNIGQEEIDAATQVLHSVFLTNASQTIVFEKRFSEYLGIAHTVAVNSCTAALHLALEAFGIGEGDEVITTPMSFIATSNAILHARATPVFVDIEPDTGNIDTTRIEAAITDKTKAILPVHLYGNLCDMKAIRTLADKHDLIVIEDAAHCIEGERDGVRVGELGDAAGFSFYATKNITSGEGGALSLHDGDVAEKLLKLRLHGINKDAASRYTGKFQHWDMDTLGYKYNISDIHSSLLLGQLERIETLLEAREKVSQFYERRFLESGVRFVKVPPATKSARHLFVIQTDNRDDTILKLQQTNIGVAVNYNPIHLNSYYREAFGYKEGDFPLAEQFGASVISIPLYPKLTEEAYEYVAQSVIDTVRS